MPKKFAGENSKAVAARARKASSKEAETLKKQKEVEDAYWKDDEKHTAKKQQRKVDISADFKDISQPTFTGRTRKEETAADREKS